MSRLRINFSQFQGYLVNDWQLLLAKVEVKQRNDILFNADYGIVSLGSGGMDPMSIQLLGLKGDYHQQMFPGGVVGQRREIHIRESFPRLAAIDRSGHFISAILNPSNHSSDSSHIPSMRFQILEFEASTHERVMPETILDPKIQLWLRNSDKLWAYQQTHLTKHRNGKEIETAFDSDWLRVETPAATIEIEQTSKDLTEVEIIPHLACGPDTLGTLRSAVLKSLSLLWMRRVNPIMSGFTYPEQQALELHNAIASHSGPRFVYTDSKSELEWLTKAVLFFHSNTDLTKRTWQAIEPVLDSAGQYRAIQTCVAIEHLGRAYWMQQLYRGKNSFSIVNKLQEILEAMGQDFIQRELDDWRFYRDGALHGNAGFLDSEPAKKLECWASLYRLLVRLSLPG